MNGHVEQHYVREVYTKLAAHAPQSYFDHASQRNWPNVSKFVRSLHVGSVIVDIGCGANKYTINSSFVIGVDNCSEVLVKVRNTNNGNGDLVIGDALNLPFRKNVADAALCVSVLHHFSTASRRKRVVEDIAEVLAPRGKAIIYVWAKEQPHGEFASQDLLVPWNMHEIPLVKNHFPYIRFDRNSTREQRIIANSIPIEVDGGQSNWLVGSLIKFVSSKILCIKRQLPPAIPQFIKNEGLKVVSGIHRWSPSLGRGLKPVNVVESYANKLSQNVMEEAMAEALSTLRKVCYYRFYHVFRKGELEQLLVGTSLSFVSSEYESANWCAIARKE